MSIINDALKKTQENLTDKPAEKKNTAEKSEKTQNPKDNKSTINTFFIFTAFILILGAVYWLTQELKPHIKNLVSQYKTILNTAPKTKPAPVQAVIETVKPIPQPEKKPDLNVVKELKLNGIIYSEDGNAALIDNNIYEEGDNINGFVITEIQLKKVILEKDGHKVELEPRN